MTQALQLLITIGGAVAALSAIGGVIWRVALKPRYILRDQALKDIKDDVQKTRTVTVLSAKAIIAMADELATDGKIDGRTSASTTELRNKIYEQIGGC